MNDVATRVTFALGILLLLCGCGEDPPGTDSSAVTWYRDVLPVAQNKCVGCHNDDAATFSMTTWSEDLASRAGLMAGYTEAGIMPPWKPASDCNSFVGERHLSSEEIALFAAWADGGAVAGDPADAPPPPEALQELEWIDRTMKMTESYTPKPKVNDPVNDQHCFVLDPELTQNEQLIGVDVWPGERKVVHHVLLYLADAAEADALDDADPQQGYSCFGGPGASNAKVIAGWVPGMPPNRYPASTGIPLAAGNKIIMQVHYNIAQAGPLPDQTSVVLQLAQEPMESEALITPMSDPNFNIPPQTQGYTTEVLESVPARATIWAVAPHMHLLGRSTRVEVKRADGSSECLLDIPDWDFNWQQFYFFDSPTGVQLDKGDQISFSCTWDNPLDKTVGWGDGTEDEMCISYMYITAGWGSAP